MKDKVKFKLWEVIVIVTLATLFMSVTTGFIVYKKFNSGTVSTTNNKYVNNFIKAYNDVVDNYYEDVLEDKIIDAAINGMMSYLDDDYTTYLDEYDTEDLTESLRGTYEGIGITIAENDDGNIEIKKVLDGSSASEVGIKIGDIVKSINGTSVLGKYPTELTDLIDKVEGAFKIEVLRDDETLEFEVEKRELIVPALTSEVKTTQSGKKVGYLYLSSFTSSLGIQVKEELKKFDEEKINNLIIDVRYNSGGYLQSTTDILELFLNKNELMFSLEYKKDTIKYKAEIGTDKKYNIVVLINGASASASEVLASSLKDNGKATIIGSTSYGKGKVQMTGELDDGSMYKYTSAKWFRPNGECIDGVGIKPDIAVDLNENYLENPIEENDNQLMSAISYFN